MYLIHDNQQVDFSLIEKAEAVLPLGHRNDIDGFFFIHPSCATVDC
jgi:hypothetical protein